MLAVREVPSVKQFQELAAAGLLLRCPPAMLTTWLMPRVHNYADQPSHVLSYISIAVLVMLQTARAGRGMDLSVRLGLLASLAAWATNHHHPLRCFVQICFTVMYEALVEAGVLAGYGDVTDPSAAFGLAMCEQLKKMYRETPDLRRFLSDIDARLLQLDFAVALSARGILWSSAGIRGYQVNGDAGVPIFEGCPFPILEQVQYWLSRERGAIRRGLEDLQAAKVAGLESVDDLLAARRRVSLAPCRGRMPIRRKVV